MVTTFFLQTQFGEDRCTQFRVIVVTNPHTPTNRQNRLQYTAAAASVQCNYPLTQLSAYTTIRLHTRATKAWPSTWSTWAHARHLVNGGGRDVLFVREDYEMLRLETEMRLRSATTETETRTKPSVFQKPQDSPRCSALKTRLSRIILRMFLRQDFPAVCVLNP